MDNQVAKWREEHKHLPPFMRDFHDAKDLFKSIEQFIQPDDDHPARKISSYAAHCYTVDIFLWFMARHGYTLQKSRARLDFDDLDERLEALKKERDERSAAVLMSALTGGATDRDNQVSKGD